MQPHNSPKIIEKNFKCRQGRVKKSKIKKVSDYTSQRKINKNSKYVFISDELYFLLKKFKKIR